MTDDDVTQEEHDRRAAICALHGWHYQRGRQGWDYDPPYVMRYRDDHPTRWLVSMRGAQPGAERWTVDMHLATGGGQPVGARFLDFASFDEAMAHLIQETGRG